MATKQYDNYADLITFTRASTGTALRHVGYGSELVTNGTFDTDVSGWIGANSARTLSWSSGSLRITANVDNAFSQAYQTIPVTIGSVYLVSADIGSGTEVGRILLSNTSPTAASIGTTTFGNNISVERIFVATTTTLHVSGQLIGANTGEFCEFDNISVKEVIFDRATDPLVLFNHPTNVPRIEYDANGNRRGLLIEEARTNLVPASNDWGNGTYWSTIRATFTANQAVSPDGSVNADALTEDTTASSTHLGLSSSNITVVDAAIYTSSIFVKANTRSWVQLQEGQGVTASAYFNLATGEIGTVSGTGSPSASIQDVGNGWYRCSLTFTSLGTAARIRLYLATGNGGATYTGDGTSGVFLWGAQLEAGSFPTSYILTSGAAASRSADVASIPTSAFGYNQKAGTVVVEHQSVASVNQRSASINDGTSNNAIQIVVSTSGGGSLVGEIRTNATGQMFQPSPIGITAGQNYKIAMAYAENDAAVSRDGTTPGTDSSVVVPAVSNLVIGAGTSSFAFLNGHIKSIQYYPRRLSNQQLVDLTS